MRDIESIRTFLRVVERGSFTAVAREIGIGQPAVSKQIAALESDLGVQLLRRSTGSLAPTDAGQELYEAMVRVVDDLDASFARVGKGQAAPSGLVRVTAPHVFGRLYLVPRLPAFFERYPQITVDLRASERLPGLVEEGLDLAIHTGEIHDSSLTALKIASTPIVTVATPDYLARHGTPSRPSDLEAHRCVVYAPFGSPRAWRFTTDEGPVTHLPRGSFRSNDAEQLRAAVLAGLGIAFVPGWLFARELASGEVRSLLKRFAPAPLPVSALHAAGRRLPTRVRLFVEFVAGVFEQEPQLRAMGRAGRPRHTY
jgi:DNA-binding transcriptional LysR family regulator